MAEEEVNETDITNRLRRIEGQIRGLSRMLEEKGSCEALIIQVLAVRAAIDRVASEILKHHVDQCLNEMSPAEAKSAISRAVQLMNKII
ncbi:MAG TPA: metal-sensitive transcriptional regulator [Ktedonobacterales bacterium]|jgi:DNA-binding FrmR family transcriptional regulator